MALIQARPGKRRIARIGRPGLALAATILTVGSWRCVADMEYVLDKDGLHEPPTPTPSSYEPVYPLVTPAPKATPRPQ